jgi:hypothetical protein
MQIASSAAGFFYGNYFYGVCAVGLSVEATLQQELPLAPIPYYLAVFALSTWYYTLPYLQSSVYEDPRTRWYMQHRKWVNISQVILLAYFGLYALFFIAHYGQQILKMSTEQWLLALAVPFIGVLYYGVHFDEQYNLRRFGILKPFFIGFCWAGLTTLYPALWYRITQGQAEGLDPVGYRLFGKNLMFVALIGIMFDIKDYASDSKQRLYTFVVQTGLRNTLYTILLPLSVIGLAIFWAYAFISHFSTLRTVLNTLPFVGLLIAVFALKKRRSILYYLAMIDGLLLLKAICGSIAEICN